jgi:superfamily II DNA or RNA helicase
MGILINLADLQKYFSEKQISTIEKELTVEFVKVLGTKYFSKTSRLHKTIISGQNQWMSVARFSGVKNILQKHNPNVTYKYVNKITVGSRIEKDFAPGVDLFDYQQICYDYLMNNIYNAENIVRGSASCIFVMDTGLGKTLYTLAFVEHFALKTLIILPSKAGLLDWIKEISKVFPALTIGQYHSTCKKDGDIVIMIIKSALKDKFTFGKATAIDRYEYFKTFGLVIFDEIHDLATEGNQEIFWQLNRQITIGITATPDERADEMDIVYYKHLGKVIRARDIPGFKTEHIAWKGHVKIIKYKGPAQYTEKLTNALGWTDTVSMCKQLATDPYRNKLIMEEIYELYRNGYYTFIFAEHCNILRYFEDQLVNSATPFISEGSDVIKYMGGATAEDKENAETYARIVLTTFQYGKQSVNIKKMTAIVFATPRRNKMRQILGRVLRKGSDESIVRQIIDIVDAETPLKSQLTDRKKIYAEKKFSIQAITKSYTAITLDSVVQS